jgi:hypothetical protein
MVLIHPLRAASWPQQNGLGLGQVSYAHVMPRGNLLQEERLEFMLVLSCYSWLRPLAEFDFDFVGKLMELLQELVGGVVVLHSRRFVSG